MFPQCFNATGYVPHVSGMLCNLADRYPGLLTVVNQISLGITSEIIFQSEKIRLDKGLPN